MKAGRRPRGIARGKTRERRKAIARRARPKPLLTPASLYAYASDFLSAARAARQPSRSFRPAQYYLTCHALELVFKAFLSLGADLYAEPVGRARVRDLSELLAGANLMGLREFVQLGPRKVAEIRKASLYYSETVFEYPALAAAFRGYPHKPRLDILLAAADELVGAVREPCLALGSPR